MSLALRPPFWPIKRLFILCPLNKGNHHSFLDQYHSTLWTELSKHGTGLLLQSSGRIRWPTEREII